MRGDEVRGPALVSVAILLAALAAGSTGSVMGASTVPISPVPMNPGNPVVNFTLFGNAGRGWGFSNGTITEPGPTLVVRLGDTVGLTLIANDSAPHNWFIDYDNGLAPNGDEPNSPDFNVPAGTGIAWAFVADRPGNWTYRCRIHPTSMTGTITVLAEPRPVNITLYANTARGWGLSNATISEPGPAFTVFAGTNVTLTLIANDSAPHNWFIDYDNGLAPSAGEPSSPDFNTGTTTTVVWSFIADRGGNWTYRCRIHPTSMTGSILVIGGSGGPGVGPSIPLITAIMLATLGGVLVFAAVYHVRAVRAAKRRR